MGPLSRGGVSGPVQIAYLVDDVGQAAQRHSRQFGSGPFFVAEHVPLLSALHAGAEASFDHSSAYGQWGPVMVELVSIHRAEPESLFRALGVGTSGVHHVARFVDDLDSEATHLEASDCPQVLMATTAQGQRFAFHQGTGQGHLLEIYEPSERLRSFYAQVAEAAHGWDGRRPLRPLASRSTSEA